MNNNYERIFMAIKSECDRQRNFAEISCFDKIADIAKVPIDKLPLYLGQLQADGLIRCSVSERYIYLTPAGRARQIVDVGGLTKDSQQPGSFERKAQRSR